MRFPKLPQPPALTWGRLGRLFNRRQRRMVARLLDWTTDGIGVAEAISMFAFGQSGSGKTTSFIYPLLVNAVKNGMGCYLPTTKPDDREQLLKLLRPLTDKIIVLAPDTPHVYDAFAFLAAGSPDPALSFVDAVMSLGELVQREHGSDSGEKVWEQYARQMLFHAATIVLAATGSVRVADVHAFMLGAALSPEQATSPAFLCTQHFQWLDAAGRATGHARLRTDVAKAFDYWILFYPSWSERTRSSAQGQAFVVLEMLFRGLAAEKLSAATPTFSPAMLEEGYVVIDDYPFLKYRELGLMLSGTTRFACQAMVNRRVVTKTTTPVLFIVDEAHYHLTTQDSTFLSTCRSQRGICAFAAQNVELLQNSLGGREDAKTAVEALLQNFPWHFYFNNAGATNTFAAERIGKTLKFLVSASSQRNWGQWIDPWSPPASTTTASVSQHFEYLCEPRVMTTLQRGGPAGGYVAEAIVFASGRPLAPHGGNFDHIRLPQVILA